MRRTRSLTPVTVGILVGLGWGLFAALMEGLPLLLEGEPWPYLGERLLALAYLAAIYGVLCAVAGGLLGAVLWLVSRLAKLQVGRPGPKIAGLFAGATAFVLWTHRFDPHGWVWAVFLLLAAAVGIGIGWLLSHASRAGGLAWRRLRSVVLVAFLIAIVALGATAGFRTWLRDLPLFDPPVTAEQATARQPNIVLITAGGIRPDHLGVYGYDAAGESQISPNIDALAERGARFEQAFTPASWGEPALASLFTSLYPSQLGISCQAAISCQPHLDGARLTLAEMLKEAGYRTQAYLTDPWLTAELGFDQGFDGFETVRGAEPFDLGALRGGTLGRLLGCRQESAACRLMTQGYNLLFDMPLPLGWGGDQANARVSHFLDLHRDERFFLWIHYTEALPPYSLEAPFRPLASDPLASPERRLKSLGYWELGDPFTAREELLPLDTQGLLSLYDAEVHRVDRLVGGVNGLIEAYGLVDRTLIVFTSDHGQEFMEHGGYTYGHSLYDEVLRVPLVIAGPGVEPPGQTVATPASLLDLAPTLMQTAGASAPPEAEGRSLAPALRGQALDERPIYGEALYRAPHELKALRVGGYKLIYNVDDGSVKLYDLVTDPSEQLDAKVEGSQIVESMKGQLFDWMAHTLETVHDLPRAAPPTEFRDAAW